jgi:regulator of sigma E protease
MEFLGSVFWLLLALAVLVTFHEYGHFVVARRFGVRVLCFSVGFGRAIWSRTARDGTRYQIAAIPLGGYVKMLDERAQTVHPDDRHQAFNRKPVGQRIAIVAAGPIFNLILAIFAFWLMFVIGIPDQKPMLGPSTGLAAEAGLQEEDLIIAVDQRRTENWTHVLLGLMPAALDRRAVTVDVESVDGLQRQLTLPLNRLGPEFTESETLSAIGLRPWQPRLPAVISVVNADSAAERAGLMAGDRVTALNERAIEDWSELIQALPEEALDAEGEIQSITLTFERDGRSLQRQARPEQVDGRVLLGIQVSAPDDAMQALFDRAFAVTQYGPLAAFPKATDETWRLTTATLGILGRMLTGRASLDNLSGPITIAQMAQSSARLGLSRFLFFLGLISLSLAIINLLPIPMLDGGHLLYYLAEVIKGSPVSERTQVLGQYVGLAMIVSLMSLAIFNDLLRLLP